MIATAKQMDIIDEFKNVVIEYCDSPEVFIESAGYYLVSALLGRFYTCPSLPHGNPNLWIVISSIPGRCRRSNVQNYTMKVYDKVMRKFAEEKLKNRNIRIIEQNKKLPPNSKNFYVRRKRAYLILHYWTPLRKSEIYDRTINDFETKKGELVIHLRRKKKKYKHIDDEEPLEVPLAFPHGRGGSMDIQHEEKRQRLREEKRRT